MKLFKNITDKKEEECIMNFSNTTAEVTSNLIAAGEAKVKRPLHKMIILGIFAGMLIGAGAMASSVAMHDIANVGLARLVAGLVFPIGFVMMVLFGGELFTGACLMIMGLLKGKYNIANMIRVLITIFISNLIGGLILAILVAYSGQFKLGDGAMGAFTIKLALSKANISFGSAFISGILCNFFVCFGVVMAGLSKDISGKVLASFLPIMTFVTGGFEHCVANMFYIPAGIFAAGDAKFAEVAMTKYGITAEKLATLNWQNFFIKNELPVTLGNIVGGMLFIGVALFILYARED